MAAGTRGVFYSSAGYTRQAVEWAGRNGVALFVLGFDGAEPVSQAAHALVLNGSRRTGRRVGFFAEQRRAQVEKRLPDLRNEIDDVSARATLQAATGSTRKRRRAEDALRTLREVRRIVHRIEGLDPTAKGLDRAIRDVQAAVRKARGML
ncbi:hypothetical protein ASD18_19755 [Cellulomonas sp. Root137]|nr:hypothetical protein ASD18_19755 [Cellulomonas sp. Root137]